MKYKVTREIRVKVYDYIDAESLNEAKEMISNDDSKSIIGEISDSGIAERHSCVSYDHYEENIESLS